MNSPDRPNIPGRARPSVLRPAETRELDLVHSWQVQAIDASPYYNDAFKAHEKRRMSRAYLQRLHEADPSYILLPVAQGVPAGFMISAPELGTLWLHWGYLEPEHRRGGFAMSAVSDYIAYWNNGRFHKIVTICRTTNRTSRLLLQRQGYVQLCTLENHIFGEDYLMFERKLNKASTGYDTGIASEGRLGRLKRRVLNLAGRGRGA